MTRYPENHPNTVLVRKFLETACSEHIHLDLGDRDLVTKLCSGDEARYWQQLSEILLGHELRVAGLPLKPSHEGPDFLIEHGGQRIWIEVICPQAAGIPEEWLTHPFNRAFSYPHEAILLRWTAAIKEKAEKLLGNPGKGIKGYLDKGVVGPHDVYVIAVNGRLLRGPHFASISGISQYPCAVEAVFAVGPMQVTIDQTTLKALGSEHQHRPIIKKPSGAGVPAYTFLDPAFRPISAVWAVDIDETWVIGNMKPMAVIHNPDAANPLPTKLLPCHHEYLATPSGAGEYALETHDGLLATKVSE